MVETERRNESNLIQETGANLRTEGLKTEIDTEVDAVSHGMSMMNPIKDADHTGMVNTLLNKMNHVPAGELGSPSRFSAS